MKDNFWLLNLFPKIKIGNMQGSPVLGKMSGNPINLLHQLIFAQDENPPYRQRVPHSCIFRTRGQNSIWEIEWKPNSKKSLVSFKMNLAVNFQWKVILWTDKVKLFLFFWVTWTDFVYRRFGKKVLSWRQLKFPKRKNMALIAYLRRQ